MRNIIYWTICVILYITVLVRLVLRRRDIVANPKKYADIPGWDKYRRSCWYERGYHRYGKHYHAGLLFEIPGLFLFSFAYHLAGTLIQKHLLIPRDALFLSSPGLMIGVIACIFFYIYFADYLCFRSKRPMLIAARLYAHSSDTNPAAWRKMTTGLLTVSVLCLPVMLYSVSTWSYADSEALVTHRIWSPEAQVIAYDTIVSAETGWSANDGQTEFFLSYELTLEDGTSMELNDYFGETSLARLHALLMEQNVPFTPGEVDAQTYERMKLACGASAMELIDAAFLVNGP